MLHLSAVHQVFLKEVEGLCEVGQKSQYLYRSIGIMSCQKKLQQPNIIAVAFLSQGKAEDAVFAFSHS